MFEIIEKYNFWNDTVSYNGFIRKSYLNAIAPYLDNRLVKVIAGQRRVGKSTIAKMLIHYLIKDKGVNPFNILYINKDIYELEFINDDKVLFSVIQQYHERLKPQGRVYIFIDEIQEITGWEKVVNSLSQDFVVEYEVFITGSNSKLLSNELSSYLTGRFIQFEVLPFDYTEYTEYFGLAKNKQTLLQYLQNGGMPETFQLPNEDIKKNYLNQLKDSIVLKDIAARYKIRDVQLLGNCIDYLIDSVGSMFSVNSIVHYLNSHKIKTNNETLGSYIQYIEDTFLVHSIRKYDLKGKELMLNEKKYYLNDLGFKFALHSGFDFSIGKYLENLVYLHLKRSGYTIYIGRISGREVDFIAENSHEKKYIQVCYALTDDTVIDREFGSLELIDDNYEKIVLSLDDIALGNRKGIKHQLLYDFL